MERYLIPRTLSLGFVGALLFVVILHGTGIVSADRLGTALPLLCPFKALTGIPCPGCGMTRAMLSFAEGDLRAAAHYNPFSFFLLLLVGVSLMPARWLRKMPSITPAALNCFYVVVLAVVLCYWIVERLIPAI